MKTLLVSINDVTMLDEIRIAIEQIPGVVSVIEDTSYDATNCVAHREAMDDIIEWEICKATNASTKRSSL